MTLKLRKCFKFSSMVVPAGGRGTCAGNIRGKHKKFLIARESPSSQGYGFSCGHVWIRELDCEEG